MTPHSSAPNGYGYPGHYPGPAPYPTPTAAPTGKAARVLGWILIVLASIFTLGWLLYTLTTAAAGALDASNMLPKGGADELPAYVIPGIIGLLAAMGTGPLASSSCSLAAAARARLESSPSSPWRLRQPASSPACPWPSDW